MNTEEAKEKHNPDSFQEIEIQDFSNRQSMVYIPNNAYFPASIQVPKDPQPTIIIPINDRDIKFNQIMHFAKFVRWVALLEFCMVFTYLIIGAVFLLSLLFIPFLGFLGGKKLNKCLSVFYLIYLILSVLLRIILMAAEGNVAFIVVGTFVLVSNLIAVRYLVKFVKMLKFLSPQERDELLILVNGASNKKMENRIPHLDFNAVKHQEFSNS